MKKTLLQEIKAMNKIAGTQITKEQEIFIIKERLQQLNEAVTFHANDDEFIEYIDKILKQKNLKPVDLSAALSMNDGSLLLHDNNDYSIYANYTKNDEFGPKLKDSKIVVGISKSQTGGLRNLLKNTLRGFDSMGDAKKYAVELFIQYWPMILQKRTANQLGYKK